MVADCFANCSPTRANKWYFRTWQIPPTVPLDAYAVLYAGNTSFLWDTNVIQRHWNSNKAFFFFFLKSMYVWAHSRGVKCTARSFLQCCPRGIGNRSVFLTFCFLVRFILCNVFEYSANTSALPPFLWVFGKAGSSQAAVHCGAAKVLRCISSAGIQCYQ